MRKITALTAALLMGVGVSAGAIAATDTQKCGSNSGKALAGILSALLKESARACAKTETGGPDGATAVKHATSAKMTGSFDAKIGSLVDKLNLDVDADGDFDDVGDVDSCPFDIGDINNSADIRDSAQLLADQACSPTS